MSLATVIADVKSGQASAPNTYDPTPHLVGIVSFLLLVFATVTYDRFVSWDRDADGKPEPTKRIWRGILLPNVIAIVIFAVYRFNT